LEKQIINNGETGSEGKKKKNNGPFSMKSKGRHPLLFSLPKKETGPLVSKLLGGESQR